MKFIQNNFVSLCALTFQVFVLYPSNIKLIKKMDGIYNKMNETYKNDEIYKKIEK
jgi:hypothetical protein